MSLAPLHILDDRCDLAYLMAAAAEEGIYLFPLLAHGRVVTGLSPALVTQVLDHLGYDRLQEAHTLTTLDWQRLLIFTRNLVRLEEAGQPTAPLFRRPPER